MIPAIPAEGALPAGPTCCTDVFDFAEALLNWIWTGTEDDPGIAECVGEGDGCGEMVRYVSWGPPIIRPLMTANLLAVYLVAPAFALRTSLPSSAAQLTPITDITLGIELWEGCYPVPPDNGDGPTYAQWHEANRHAYAHGTKLWARLLEGYTANFSQINAGCQTQRLLAMSPLEPGAPGLSVGWRTSLQVTW